VEPCNSGKERVCAEKEKENLLLREERGEVCKFIKEQLRKKYIRPSKSPQKAPSVLCRKEG